MRTDAARSMVRGKAHDAPNSARAKVRRGIAWLNQYGPKDWRQRAQGFSTVTDGEGCILDRVFGFKEGFAKLFRTTDLKLAGRYVGASHWGFNATLDGAAAVDRAWRSELRAR